MNIIIITGHNHFATGIYSSLKMIAGAKENIIPIDFTDQDTDLTLRDKINSELIKHKEVEVLFACDLLGGTPYKECAKLSLENPHYEVVTGFNMGGLLDASFKIELLSIHELAEALVEGSKKNILLVPKKVEEEISNDGI